MNGYVETELRRLFSLRTEIVQRLQSQVIVEVIADIVGAVIFTLANLGFLLG
ncbi:MAG: hypothetical protein KAS36_12725 [Anaerolineales bacterium]|nr:hypothetical protein [Anaerolineales bacterium]